MPPPSPIQLKYLPHYDNKVPELNPCWFPFRVGIGFIFVIMCINGCCQSSSPYVGMAGVSALCICYTGDITLLVVGHRNQMAERHSSLPDPNQTNQHDLLVCCRLPCQYRRKWRWWVVQVWTCVDRRRFAHCREYLSLYRPANLFRPSKILPLSGHE